MPDQPAPNEAETQDRKDECSVVPDWDVRICMVCRRPMEGRKCKYICRSCGTMIDCSDAY